MPKSLRWALLASILLHMLLLLAVLFWSIQPALAPQQKRPEFISLEYLDEIPALAPAPPEPLPPEPPRREASLTGSSAPQKKQTAKRPVIQTESLASDAPAAKSSDDIQPESAVASAEATSPEGPPPGEASVSAGQLALSFRDFQSIKGDLLIPPVKGKLESSLPMTALPTFTPSAITASNQAPLRELTAPFSAYLHSMHLKIHPFWSEGALSNFEEMDAESPLNNLKLELTIELVINADGSLESASPLGSSGDSRYDMMAMYAVKHAAPFDTPPARLLSYQDKVYVRWTLYRDARECAATLAQPYWLVSAERPTPNSLSDAAPLLDVKPRGAPSTTKDKLIAGAKAVKNSVGPQESIRSDVKADGFGGSSTLPDHSVFDSSGGELIIPFNLSKKKPAAPPVDELSNRKR